MRTINRREFCAAVGLAAAGPAALLPASGEARQPVHGFIDESGKRGDWPLVVGLLATSDPIRHELRIGYLRRRYGYPRVLKYMSTDRNKVGFAAALIDYYAAADDLAFTALLVDDSDGKWPTIGEGKDALYASLYRRLIETAATSDDLVVRLKHRPENKRDRLLHGFLATELAVRTEIGAKRRSPANLTQLAGFLAGCVYGEVTGVRHVVKRTLADRLKVRLGAASLAGNSAADLRKLAVTAIAI